MSRVTVEKVEISLVLFLSAWCLNDLSMVSWRGVLSLVMCHVVSL